MIILDELPEELKRLESQYDPEVPNHRISVEFPEVSFRGRAPHEINFKCHLRHADSNLHWNFGFKRVGQNSQVQGNRKGRGITWKAFSETWAQSKAAGDDPCKASIQSNIKATL